jgi:Phage ABA sandwich domain
MEKVEDLRAFDVWVAEKVMGWQRNGFGEWLDGCEYTGWCDAESKYSPCYNCGSSVAWRPTEDIAAAWRVVERFARYNPFWKRPGHMDVMLAPANGPHGWVGWAVNFGDSRTVAYGDSLPLAICFAAREILDEQYASGG